MHENEVCYRHRRSNRRGFRGENISVVAFIVGLIIIVVGIVSFRSSYLELKNKRNKDIEEE